MKPQTVKQELRRLMQQARDNLAPDLRQRADCQICTHLAELNELKQAEKIAGFYPAKGEPDFTAYLVDAYQSGKKLAFPRCRENHYGFAELPGRSDAGHGSGTGADAEANFPDCFTPGAYGIPEPKEAFSAVPETEFSTMTCLVPGVAFDRQGHRLGRGAGVYDRLLKAHSGLKIGISYECQITAAVPITPQDIDVDLIVTEKQIYRCG